MDGVPMPLDIAWFDSTGQIVGVARMPVCEIVVCPTYASLHPYRWAIEAPVGSLEWLRDVDRLVIPADGPG
jgi:uncharacterized membrane protein (UPF0127 family)